jgi:xanthine dehydrogenase accessory factor
MKNIYGQILNKYSGGSSLVLATVIRTQGSTPQKPGSSALFGKSGLISGTVGGGILEGKVQGIALKAIKARESGIYDFFLDKDITEKEEAICGGQISILIDARPQNHIKVFNQMNESLANRTPGVLITQVDTGTNKQVLIRRYWLTEYDKTSIPEQLMQKIEPEVHSLLAKQASEAYRELEYKIPDQQSSVLCFLETVFPPCQLIIAGAGHIGKALAHLGQLLDFEVTVVDDRPDFANSKNIPDADYLVVEEIGKAMQRLKKSQDTYIVIVTRGHKDDAEALKPCISSGAAYVGMIGSKSKIARMKAEFIKKRWATEDQWNEVYAPVGLDIKSKSVEEIAVSIAAQLILVRRSNSMSDTR